MLHDSHDLLNFHRLPFLFARHFPRVVLSCPMSTRLRVLLCLPVQDGCGVDLCYACWEQRPGEAQSCRSSATSRWESIGASPALERDWWPQQVLQVLPSRSLVPKRLFVLVVVVTIVNDFCRPLLAARPNSLDASLDHGASAVLAADVVFVSWFRLREVVSINRAALGAGRKMWYAVGVSGVLYAEESISADTSTQRYMSQNITRPTP